MPDIVSSSVIAGVRIVQIHSFSDARGSFAESFRKEWFPELSWAALQMNCSRSRAGVLRGLHYHRRQTDYWFLVDGRLRAGLVDLRRNSPTYAAAMTIDLSASEPIGLFIPVGVAHGFLALTDVILTYLVDNYYDAQDEFGIAWDDPALGLDWGLGGQSPLVSGRDRNNPRLADIEPLQLPAWRGE
jgi:dTDP-4-dehydrorhamnose 3,5-epimerase